jgi:hypothetical protein
MRLMLTLYVLVVFFFSSGFVLGCDMAQLVEVLRYNPEGRGFDSAWGHWDISVT